MVMPKKYYDGMDKKVRMPLLDMVETTSGVIEVVCVDEEGQILAYLFDSESGATSGAKDELEKDGFSTDWALWDEKGKFRRVV